MSSVSPPANRGNSAAIVWNTDVNAPGCPGEILAVDGRSVLVQIDYDHPGVAGSFGWSLCNVQRCPTCKAADIAPVPDYRGSKVPECQECGEVFDLCEHSPTDGTIDCPECGATASDFIAAAGEWLRNNDGATADDPGYFAE